MAKKRDETVVADIAAKQAADRARAEECWREIEVVLRKHRCQLVPYFQRPDTIGGRTDQLLLTAAFGVIPSE